MPKAAWLALCSLALASCGSSDNASPGNNAAVAANSAAPAPALVDTLDDGAFPDYMDQMSNTPEVRARFWASRTDSKCTPAAFYPNGDVPPAFYTDWELPQREAYKRCLEDEARHEGRRDVRLAVPSDFPRTGTCYETRIAEASGSSVTFENGIDQTLINVASRKFLRNRVGDPARVCIVHIPENCPANDLRGIRYSGWNRRTGDRWEEYAAISQHLCWGA